MLKREDDVSVWNSFLSGDDHAYEYIYRQHVRKLFLYGITLTSDEELVKDCIHDVFIRIYKNRQNLGKTNNIRLYLISSLKNALLMAFRKQSIFEKFKNSIKEEDLTDDETAMDKMINHEAETELKSRIDNVWSVLTNRQKEIIYYKFVEGLSLAEIAKIENINYQSIANIIQRSLKKMKNFYDKTE